LATHVLKDNSISRWW